MMKNHTRTTARRNKQGGFTAVELIVVLIVGLGIIALAAGKMDMLFDNSNVTEEVSNINTLFANTRSLRTATGYGIAGAALNGQLFSINGVPRNMSQANPVITNVWGGAVTVASTGTGFSISQAGMPAGACVKIATRIAQGGTFASVQINGNAARVGGITAANAIAECNAAANTLLFTSLT